MSLQELSEWYYLIYVLPLGLSMIMIAFSAISSATDGDGASDGGDAGDASGGDAGDVGDASGGDGSGGDAGDASGDGGDGDADSDGGDDGDGDRGSARVGSHPVLSFFGFGRIPTLLLAQGFGLFWGATGFYATRMLASEEGATPETFALRAAEIAALSGVLGIKVIGEIGSRFMPSHESYVLTREDLIGTTGVAIFPVSGTMGRVRVYDSYGALHDESARLVPDEAGIIEKGESVLLVRYDETGGFFLVEKSPV